MCGFVLVAALMAGSWLQPARSQASCDWVAGPAHDYCTRSDDEVQPGQQREPFTAGQTWTLTGTAAALTGLLVARSVRAGRTRGRERGQ
ncbi:hypothetical protein [Streptomyces sp. NPDC127038]|uniref:hypothetical protein n=1 Tax=Streptomyces sp. NPDC127038 TaxID=3347114 RepID=UPI00365E3014